MESVVIHPGGKLKGTITVPGDKSISHRVAILSGLAHGKSFIRGFLRSGDCLSTLACMKAMGADFQFNGEILEIKGMAGGMTAPVRPLDCGNSGTSMRLLSGLVAGQSFTAELIGDASLSSRPMGRIREPLEKMGAKVELLGPGGKAPVRITGGQLRGIDYTMPVASAQVKSCVLLAALFAEGTTTVQEPLPTRDHTERFFQILGIPVSVNDRTISLVGYGPKGPSVQARSWLVPGDISSAAFWLVAGAAMAGARVTLENIGLNPRRSAILDVLRRMGGDITVKVDERSLSPEPCGMTLVKGGALRGTEIGGAEIPNIIDELPVVAVAGALAEGRTTIRDARELRVKESDRIASMAENLRRLGVRVEEREDGMTIEGPAKVRGGVTVESFGDHRVAMALAVLAQFADGPVTLRDVACVATSYPGFWDDLKALGGHVETHHSH